MEFEHVLNPFWTLHQILEDDGDAHVKLGFLGVLVLLTVVVNLPRLMASVLETLNASAARRAQSR
jgi:hypothetical protein